MKKFILIFFLVFCSSIFAQSPVSKGTYTVGGNIGFTSISEDGNSDTKTFFTFAPKLGYFFIDNFYTGTTLMYVYSSSGDFSNNTYGIGLVTRYYFSLEKIKPFLGLEYLYSIMTSNDSNDELTQTNFTMSVGLDYFITNYFALEGSINYTMTSHTFSYNSGINDINRKLFNIGIGANYFIN